jgi:hypothetical protein
MAIEENNQGIGRSTGATPDTVAARARASRFMD